MTYLTGKSCVNTIFRFSLTREKPGDQLFDAIAQNEILQMINYRTVQKSTGRKRKSHHHHHHVRLLKVVKRNLAKQKEKRRERQVSEVKIINWTTSRAAHACC